VVKRLKKAAFAALAATSLAVALAAPAHAAVDQVGCEHPNALFVVLEGGENRCYAGVGAKDVWLLTVDYVYTGNNIVTLKGWGRDGKPKEVFADKNKVVHGPPSDKGLVGAFALLQTIEIHRS
jgi:uncharacterized membrane protein